MFDHHKLISRINAIVAEQCLWPNCAIKKTETGLLLSQGLSFKTYKTYITVTFAHFVLKLYKNKNLRCSFKATADAANKGKLHRICSTPYLSEDFYDGLEMKFTSHHH